ncbi:MAG: hypothetical protein C5S45_09895 [Candidatus Methanocomedens sp.]|nr:MAG: hypothetical protein C5S45_09895 [ANME-2 cluster archaeon]
MNDNDQRKKSLENIQAVNTESVEKNIELSNQILDKLIQSFEKPHELRKLRKKLSTLSIEVQDKNLTAFKKKTSSYDNFITAENQLKQASDELISRLEEDLNGEINVKSISILVNNLENGINSRLIPTDELINQSQASTNKEESPTGLIPRNLKNELHLYLNMLQTKYSKNRPEILFGGDYAGDLNWKYIQEHDNIKAKLSSLFEVSLVLEARYQHKDVQLIELIQKDANKVKNGRHKCVCLINRSWDEEIKDFTLRFVHPDFVLYLYDLDEGLILNTENEMTQHYAYWFNTEHDKQKLDEMIESFLDSHEHFTVRELEDALDLNYKGTEKLIKILLRKGTILDVTFGEKNPKFIKAKLKKTKNNDI